MTMANRRLTKKQVGQSLLAATLLVGIGCLAILTQTRVPEVIYPSQRLTAIAPISAPSGPFNIAIDPRTPLKDLLPTVPKERKQKPSAFVENLADVPEVMLTNSEAKGPTHAPIAANLAIQIARINHLNIKKPDQLVQWMVDERPDLAGLPFLMGSDCRQSQTRSRYFKQAVTMVHNSRTRITGQVGLGNFLINGPMPEPSAANPVSEIVPPFQGRPAPVDPPKSAPRATRKANVSPVELTVSEGESFLVAFLKSCIADDNSTNPDRSKEHREHANPARLAAMTQICGPTSDSMKLAMARYIASVSSVESTQALAKLILFTPEEDARNVAIEALKARRDKDYVDLLLQGFRYPWPDVAKRAGDALVKLDRKDLVPQLIDVLDEPDPRAPVTKTVDGKTLTTVREIVRINHHRNCVMCHAPGQEVQGNTEILTAETPVPDQPLPSFGSSGGYSGQGIPELLVRVDVTYLRQDFSVMLPVANSAPWPEMQRFDFVARTRVLKDYELQAYKEKFDKLEPGILPPNHRAAVTALRELTGKEAAPTAEAWRKVVSATK